jgi:hypothetical protein
MMRSRYWYCFVDWWLIFVARLVGEVRKARHDPKATGNAPHRQRRVR